MKSSLMAIVVAATVLGVIGPKMRSAAAQATYDVGPGHAMTAIGDVNWATLNAGDTVRIHWRATPYREKWVICRQGTANAPITVIGVPNASGELPVISGENAVTPVALNYWGESRSILKIGGASAPSDTMPMHVIIDNLEFRSARPGYTFTDDTGTPNLPYVNNAAGIFIEKGQFITIRHCVLRDCGNGLFVAADNGNTQDILIEKCHLIDNGIEGSIYEHNSYTEAMRITFQYNHYGPLRDDCLGNNLKDRSAGTVIRYNWIESGNRQIDLVESSYSALYNSAEYAETFVYGNVLIEPDGAGNSQIVHYGGDNGDTVRYRKGKLHLFNNTIISTRTTNTTLVRLSTNDETCDVRNNIIFVTAEGNRLALMNTHGLMFARNNFMKPGYVVSHSSLDASAGITTLGIVTGDDPGFADFAGQDFSLLETAAARNAGTALLAAVLPTHNVVSHYVKHRDSAARPDDATLDIGAFEYGTAGNGNGNGGNGNGDNGNGGSKKRGCAAAIPPAAAASAGPAVFGEMVVVVAFILLAVALRRRP